MTALALTPYMDHLAGLLRATEVTRADGTALSLDAGMSETLARMRDATAGPNKILFIGNGGSAAIASHMAVDFAKNGGMRALSLNDAAVLTCLANDLGYPRVFAQQITNIGQAGDILVAISGSGRSPNILEAVAEARNRGLWVLTLTGFAPDNPLRPQGDLNLYVPDGHYGPVEVAHATLLHALLDLAMGWQPPVPS